MAGYSGSSLPKKLGIKTGCRLRLDSPPGNIAQLLGELPENVQWVPHAESNVDVLVFFAKERAQIESRFDALKHAIYPDGGLWIAWPKQKSNITTDVTGNVIREIALARGLVDNKVCAIDDIWSGLRLVFRIKDRKQ